MIATFKKKGWMKLMVHTEKYLTHAAVDKLTRADDEDGHHHGNEVQCRYMESMYSRTKYYIFVSNERSGNR